MKKRILAMMMCLSMCFCVACGTNRKNELNGNNNSNDHSGNGAVENNTGVTGDTGTDGGAGTSSGTTDNAETVTLTCRVVYEEDGVLLLAGQSGGASEVYRIGTAGTEVVTESGRFVSGDDIEEGSLIEITYNGMIEESYPAAPNGITKIVVKESGFDDLCDMYLDVLDDLWEVDEALNRNITELGVDLSRTRLTKAEQAAVAWRFGEEHGIVPIEGTYEELVEWGYINEESLYWENGCLFSVEEKETEGEHNLNTVTFNAQKWSSGMGAYYFVDCTSVQSEKGEWSDYQIGAQAIS